MSILKNWYKFALLLILPVAMMGLMFTLGCKANNSAPTQSPEGGTPPPGEIWMQNVRFVPDTMTIDVGTSIRWINKDGIVHTVTSGIPGNPDGFFNSGNVAPGDTFRHTFTTSRVTNHYYCMLHAMQMQATITVR